MNIERLKGSILAWGVLDTAAAQYVQGLKKTVIVPEMRPSCAGMFRNIPLLTRQKVACAYCTDNMLGILFYQGRIEETLLVYSREDARGITAPSGSSYVSVLSRAHGVKIRLHKGDVLDYNAVFKDRDARTLCGRTFYADADAVTARDEEIRWDELEPYEKIK